MAGDGRAPVFCLPRSCSIIRSAPILIEEFRMALRLALAAMASIAVLHGQPNPARTRADADRLEAQVEADPGDLNARLTLLRYYWSASATLPAERVQAGLRKHAVWMIEQHPEHPSLAENWAAIPRDGQRGSDTDAAAFDAADLA